MQNPADCVNPNQFPESTVERMDCTGAMMHRRLARMASTEIMQLQHSHNDNQVATSNATRPRQRRGGVRNETEGDEECHVMDVSSSFMVQFIAPNGYKVTSKCEKHCAFGLTYLVTIRTLTKHTCLFNQRPWSVRQNLQGRYT